MWADVELGLAIVGGWFVLLLAGALVFVVSGIWRERKAEQKRRARVGASSARRQPDAGDFAEQQLSPSRGSRR